jgi:hypothetical protein
MAEVCDRPDFGDEPVGADDRGEVSPEHLDRHLALVPDVQREVDGRHSTSAEFALDAISRQKRRRERDGNVRHAAILSSLDFGLAVAGADNEEAFVDRELM